MSHSKSSPAWGFVIAVAIGLAFTGYFSFAAIAGDFGRYRREEIGDQAIALEAELSRLQAQVAYLENRTRRMSDEYLDLDLLDQQARDVLGLIRSDEILVP